MDSQSPDTRPPTPDTPSKTHMWILILLGWTAVFSLLSVGLLLTRNTDSGLSDTELSAACQNGVLNGITTNLTRISEACLATNADESSTDDEIVVKGTEEYPGFTTPANWSIAGSFNNSDIYTILIDSKPMIIRAFGTDGPGPGLLSISTQSIPSDAKSDASAYVNAQFSDSHFSNKTTTSTATGSGTLYTTAVDESVDIDGIHHRQVLHFFTANRMITVRYDKSATADAVATSFDWSSVQ